RNSAFTDSSTARAPAYPSHRYHEDAGSGGTGTRPADLARRPRDGGPCGLGWAGRRSAATTGGRLRRVRLRRSGPRAGTLLDDRGPLRAVAHAALVPVVGGAPGGVKAGWRASSTGRGAL